MEDMWMRKFIHGVHKKGGHIRWAKGAPFPDVTMPKPKLEMDEDLLI